MANSTSNIDAIVNGQGSQHLVANAFFDSASPATIFARRMSTSSGLTWGYYGGNVTLLSGAMSQIANGSLLLTASTTNYIVAKKSDGVVSTATTTTNWNNLVEYWRLYSVVTGTTTVSSYTDYREVGRMAAHFPYDVTLYFGGKPSASLTVAQIMVPRPVLFPANLAGSYGNAATTATASAALDVKKNGSSVGTITFAAGTAAATFTTAGAAAVSFAAGDKLEIVAPSSQDATLANFSLTVVGFR